MPEVNFEMWFLKMIMQERERQQKKFGEQNHIPPVWASIVTEEIGEAAREANDYYLAVINGESTPDTDAEVLAKLSKELIETAAVSLNALTSIYRNEVGKLTPKAMKKYLDIVNGEYSQP